MISGFTFAHNALAGGYPLKEAVRAVQPFVDEVVAVDMQSTDGTRQVLQELECRVIDGAWWSGDGAEPLRRAYDLNVECQGETVVMFEADEVWDTELVSHIVYDLIPQGIVDLTVTRIQITMNFQRIQWYPHRVHRVFPRGGGSYRKSPVVPPKGLPHVGLEKGMVWDCSGCFRDSYWVRKAQHSELWGSPRHIFVGDHFTEPFVELSPGEVDELLKADEWTWKTTPLAVPRIVLPLVGRAKYE